MNRLSCFFIGVLFVYQNLVAYGQFLKSETIRDRKAGKIIFAVQLNTADTKIDSLELQFSPLEVIGPLEFETVKQKLVNGYTKWNIPDINKPIWILTRFSGKKYVLWLAEPGDSVLMTNAKEILTFTGKGAEKYKLLADIRKVMESVKKPANPTMFKTTSLEDYLEWNHYLNRQLDLLTPLFDSYESKITPLALNWIRGETIAAIENDRRYKFIYLRYFAKEMGVSNKDLCRIFDSSFNSKPAQWVRSSSIGVISGMVGFTVNKVQRGFNFDKEAYKHVTDVGLMDLYYEYGKKNFRGFTRERFLSWLITSTVIDEIGFTPETESLLEKYYAEPRDQDCKNYVKAYELKARRLIKGHRAPDFLLSDDNGRNVTAEKLEEKVTLMDFWFTGCKGCLQMTPVLEKIEKEFGKDTNVVFASISIDKDSSMWKKSIAQGKYTTGNGLNLYAGPGGDNSRILRDYNINSYPTLHLLDGNRRIVENPLPDPRRDSGEQLIGVIKEQLQLLHDGPYLRYNGDSTEVSNIYGKSISVRKWSKKEDITLTVQTDQRARPLNVVLKQHLNTEPSEFTKPQKLFILSDIEGNFDQLRRLLQSNNIIDENYNWIFENGHLVLNGDMFDRGKQVTECLWLIYSLEEKAKAADGYVHFILGNHEIMNLSGDHRYANEKYRRNADKLGRSYGEIYDKNSELGRWLRTKNIIEKIGDLLFVHAGVSKEIAGLPLSIPQINDLARPFYDRDTLATKSGNTMLALLFNTKEGLSPFWYRSYYLDQEVKVYIRKNGPDILTKTPVRVIDNVLKKFDVNRIVTGHTIVEEGSMITAHYGGKVINTDTHHAAGKSEALLIEDDRYSRVSISGKKEPLFYSSYTAKK